MTPSCLATSGKEPFEAWGPDECRATLAECYRWVREVIGPLNAPADAEGCQVVDGKVVTPHGFKEAWKSLYDAGWKQIAVDAEYGGAGAPHSLQKLASGSTGLEHFGQARDNTEPHCLQNLLPAWFSAPQEEQDKLDFSQTDGSSKSIR